MVWKLARSELETTHVPFIESRITATYRRRTLIYLAGVCSDHAGSHGVGRVEGHVDYRAPRVLGKRQVGGRVHNEPGVAVRQATT